MPVSMLFLVLACMSSLGRTQYLLQDDYMANGSFFDHFTFYNGPDPSNGCVAYQTQAAAEDAGLLQSSPSNVKIMVDSTNVTPNGRPSVRLTSNRSYNAGLVILDLAHMPGGICGTWPAFWMVGPSWPNGGEVDIIEGVNDQTTNEMTLHTRDGCSMTNDHAFTGNMTTSDCYVSAPGQSENAGCQISTSNTATYGAGFNAQGGGVYATEWTAESISIYFFPRHAIPSDIRTGKPDPSTWGVPLARFRGACDIPEMFYDQQIVFDTTFCGDWAGNVWQSSPCARHAASCTAFVENNPAAFVEAYWSINALQVYQDPSLDYPSAGDKQTQEGHESQADAALAARAGSNTTLLMTSTKSVINLRKYTGRQLRRHSHRYQRYESPQR